MCVVPADAPSDVAVYSDYNYDAIRVIWSLPVFMFLFFVASSHIIAVLLLKLVLFILHVLDIRHVVKVAV